MPLGIAFSLQKFHKKQSFIKYLGASFIFFLAFYNGKNVNRFRPFPLPYALTVSKNYTIFLYIPPFLHLF